MHQKIPCEYTRFLSHYILYEIMKVVKAARKVDATQIHLISTLNIFLKVRGV